MDRRNIESGSPIPKEGYCDQPYVVRRADGAWVVCLTTGAGEEGEHGQHVISSISTDKGKTWSFPVDIEPKTAPESSWVMPFLTDYGRIYAFYVFNKDNLRRVHLNAPPGYTERVDTLGVMAYRYSDDGGLSWSPDRYEIPIRNFRIDRENPYGGSLQYFWGVGKPITHKGWLYLGFAKVGMFGEGFMERDEGAFLRCKNIHTERNPAALVWETLPEGDEGLRAPRGKCADEHNLVSLNSGDLFCTFRTVTGHNCQGYSRDDGASFSVSFAERSPGGRLFKHPRAANFVHKYENGNYTLWFHNHGRDLCDNPGHGYVGRNPAFLSGGVEKDGVIYWSEPEIVLYSKNPDTRISYPDFIEDEGEYYITETEKRIARVHHVDKTLLEGMWRHLSCRGACAREGLMFEGRGVVGDTPTFAPVSLEAGFTLTVSLVRANTKSGILLDGRAPSGDGILLEYTEEDTLRLTLSDGVRTCAWESDPLVCDTPHVTVIADGAAGIISFIANGAYMDGGEVRDYGFGRIPEDMGDVTGKGCFTVGDGVKEIPLLRVYNRYLRTYEAVYTYRYDCKTESKREG